MNKHLLNRYYQLQRLRKTDNGLTAIQQEELFNICDILLNQILKNNSDILKRLKVSDYNYTTLKNVAGKGN